MFTSIGLTISGFVFLSVIAVVYFIKKKYGNIENNIYRFQLLLTLFLLVLEFCCVLTMSNRVTVPVLNELLCRCYILGCVIWFISIFMYMMCLVSDKKYNNINELLGETMMRIFIIVCSVSYLISCFLDMTYVSGPNDNFYVIGGRAVYVLYFVFIFVGGYMLKALFKNFTRDSLIKRLPIIMFLVIYFILSILQLLYADLNELTFLFALCVVSMYFTLENQDIKLASDLKIAKQEAEYADNAKTEFLSKMSHEIRTPMNAIMGFSESLLNNNNTSEEEIKKDVKNIYNAGKGLLEIINNILIFSRIESGRENVENIEYSLLDITSELESFVMSKINPEKVDFKINIDPSTPANFIGDKLKLYRIILNVVSNSVKFTSSGSILINISCERNKKIGKLKIEVKDTGIGVKEEELKKIISSFNDKNNTSDYLNGTGLGLVVVKKLADMLDANIMFESEDEIGTKFSLVLNQEISGNINIVDLNDSDNSDNNQEYFDCSDCTILIVDDNKLNRKVIEKLLIPYNAKLEIADNGLECIEKIKTGNKFDLILLDHLMPEMDGIETIKVIKKLNKKNIPPIIAMTANVVTEIKDMYIKEGFSDYLAKPVDIKELNKILKKHIKKGGNK